MDVAVRRPLPTMRYSPSIIEAWLDRGLIDWWFFRRALAPDCDLSEFPRYEWAVDIFGAASEEPPDAEAFSAWYRAARHAGANGFGFGDHVRINVAALRSYSSAPGEVVGRLAAAVMFAMRESVEAGGVVTHHAWCVDCGAAFEDRRGLVTRIAARCEAHRRDRVRPDLRACGNAGCMTLFWPTRSDKLYCSDRCKKAANRAGASTVPTVSL